MGHLVVGVDGSYVDDPGLHAALVEAASSHRRLHAVHAFPSAPADDVSGAELRRRRARRVIDAAVQNVVLRHPHLAATQVDATVCEGSAADVLHEKSRNADLLVVTSVGAGRAERGGLGSTARDCAQRSDCPVMIVPSHLSDVPPVQRVVLALDPAEPRRHAGAWAHAEAVRHGCELVVVSVWMEQVGPGCQLAQERLDAQLALCSPPGEVHSQLLHGRAVERLLDVVRPGDVLVVGSRHRAGQHPFGLPSVSGALLSAVDCPVVLVPDEPAFAGTAPVLRITGRRWDAAREWGRR